MIGKIVAGSGAGGVTAYVTSKDGAQLLSSTWDGPAEAWASQITEHTQAMGSSVHQTVVHVSLAAAPGEHLSDDQWRAVAETYIARMGWGDHDHAVVRHTDTAHDHVHIIIARVGHDGQVADLHDDYPRQERVLDSIERDFGLTRTHEQLREQAERNPFAAVESVTRSHLTFERADIDRYFERLGFELTKVRELTDRAMSDDRVLFASTSGPTDKFTTTTVVVEVQRLDSALHQLAGQEARPTLDRGEGAREGLSDGQRAAADRIAAGGGLTVIEGFAGAGKSTMLRAAVDDLRFSGYDVIGVGSSGKAAKGLSAAAGLNARTLTSTLGRIERGELKLTRDSVVILDEAGMANNRELGALARHVVDAGGRLVQVGDDKQLPAVGRGGGFGHSREVVGERTARLDEIFRQKEGWQRAASRAFGEGRAREGVHAYIDHGRVEWAASRGTARDMLVSDYVREIYKGTNTRDMLALAHENRDVGAMNREIRDALKERGGLTGERMYKLKDDEGKVQKIALAPGDRVVFERNARDAMGKEVKNGEFGTVKWVDSRGFGVRMDDGAMRRVEDGSKQQMSHGYASSIHKSQGSTIDKVFLLASRGMDAALSYVGLSRQREDVRMYANRTEFKDAEHLKNSLGRDRGREDFKAVLREGKGKESQQQLQQGERAWPEKERQPVAGYITALAIDQGKIDPFPREDKEKEQNQQAKEKAPAQQGKEREGQAEEQQPAREAQAGAGKEQLGESQGQARGDGRAQLGDGKAQVQRENEKARDHAAGGPAGEKAREGMTQESGQQQAGQREGQQRNDRDRAAVTARAGDRHSQPAQQQAGQREVGRERGETKSQQRERASGHMVQGKAQEGQGKGQSAAQGREAGKGQQTRGVQQEERGQTKGHEQDERRDQAAGGAPSGERGQHRGVVDREQQHRAGQEQKESAREQTREAGQQAQGQRQKAAPEREQAQVVGRQGQREQQDQRQSGRQANEQGRAGGPQQGKSADQQRRGQQASKSSPVRGKGEERQAGRQERDKSQGQEKGQQARGQEKASKEQTKSKSKGYGL